jgi:hypothetical protein
MVRMVVGSVAAVVALSAVCLGGPVAAAGAQGTTCTGYAPTPLTTSPTTIAPGGVVTVSGAALPNAPVTVALRRPDATVVTLATGTASSTGAFSIQVTIPSDLAPGVHELVATSPNCPVPFTVVVTVTGPPGTTTTTVAATTTTTTGGGTATTAPSSPTSVQPSVQDAGSGVLGATEARATPAVATSGSGSSGSASDGALAFTGGEVRPYIVIAIAVIAVGALLVGTSRRRSA